MKTIEQIKAKIAEHETEIQKILDLSREEWTDDHTNTLYVYLDGRKALLWTLSVLDKLPDDDFERMVKYEILCHDASEIF